MEKAPTLPFGIASRSVNLSADRLKRDRNKSNNCHIMKIRLIKLVFIFIFFDNSAFCQIQNKAIQYNLVVNDTIVEKKWKDIIKVRKRAKNINVISLNISIKRTTLDSNSIYFYRFHKVVQPDFMFFDRKHLNDYNKYSLGILYFIENNSGMVIPAKNPIFISYKNSKDELKSITDYTYILDEKKIKIKKVDVKGKNISNDYIIGKIHFDKGDSILNMKIYPIINKFYNLDKGEYYLTLVYCFNGSVDLKPPSVNVCDINKPSDNLIYKGVLISNKIKLIIK
ncbi:MAG TPA: hypothetical protein PKZ43_08850 [Bacteroidales bacterium]|nr:hypothetical protein [Bacteroidales bacterium]HQI46600.1 hypothetical protein [Bacteroidales bacterium]